MNTLTAQVHAFASGLPVRRTILARLALCALLAVALIGCGGSDDAFDPETRARIDALVAEWRELLAEAETNLHNERYGHIVMELMELGYGDFSPMIEVLEDPDSDAYARIAASNSLNVALPYDEDGSLILNRLIPLAAPDHDPVTRAIVLQLLADGQPARFVDLFRTHRDDPDMRVRLACFSGLVQAGESEGVEAVLELMHAPDTPIQGRDWAVQTLLEGPPLADVTPLVEAMSDVDLSESTRRAAILAVGRSGDPERLDALHALAESGTLTDPLQLAVDTAITALEEQAAAGADATTERATDAEDATE